MAKAKGTTIISFAKFLRSQRDRDAVVMPPELHHYLDDHIHESRWYSEADLLGIIQAAVKLIPSHREEVLRGFGRTAASEHLHGIYTHLKGHSDDPFALPRRVFALWSSQHDTGQVKMQIENESSGSLTLEGYEYPSHEICTILTGYLFEVLTAAGLPHPNVRKTACSAAGDSTCIWTFTWG